jgi:cell division protein FtsL
MVARSHPLVLPAPSRGFHVVIGPRARRRRIGGWVGVCFIVASLFFVMISTRVALDRNAFLLDDITSQISVEESRYRELRLQVAELQSPERIASLAEARGMVYPAEIVTIEVPGLGDPGPGGEDRWVDLKALLSAQP